MGSMKYRNGMDLTEAEDIKKRWQEYTELYKKDLRDPGNHDGVITHLDPGSIPGLGRSPGGGHGNPFQYCHAWRTPWTEELVEYMVCRYYCE